MTSHELFFTYIPLAITIGNLGIAFAYITLTKKYDSSVETIKVLLNANSKNNEEFIEKVIAWKTLTEKKNNE